MIELSPNKDLFRVPRPGRVLVLAPHPDDEAVGCGGYLASLAGAGAEIAVVFVSDGGLGPAGYDASLVRRRQKESEWASKILGVQRVMHWNLPDGQLASQEMPVALLEKLLKEFNIEVVLVPHLGEAHPDHAAVAHLLGRIEVARYDTLMVMAYEIWTPLIPNCIVNVTSQMQEKLRAIRAYESQQERFKLEALAMGLGQYRAAWSRMRGWQYAECFQRYSLTQYREVCRAH